MIIKHKVIMENCRVKEQDQKEVGKVCHHPGNIATFSLQPGWK